MSWVELDGIVSEEIVRDDDIRRRVAESGRPLRPHATGMSDDDLLARLHGLGVDADREKLAASLDQSVEVTPRDGGTHPAAAFRLLNNQPGKRRAARPYAGWRRVWPSGRAPGTQGLLGSCGDAPYPEHDGGGWRDLAWPCGSRPSSPTIGCHASEPDEP